MPSILFVCLGNICRSPLAEGAFRTLCDGEVWALDSAGTGGWHAGDPPDPRAIRIARANGVDISRLRARQVNQADFDGFDYIVAMDGNNLADLERIAPDRHRAQLSLLMDHVEGKAGKSVADPYYGGEQDFAQCWKVISEGVHALKMHIEAEAHNGRK
jgi:protein-tyrosine phosphatase